MVGRGLLSHISLMADCFDLHTHSHFMSTQSLEYTAISGKVTTLLYYCIALYELGGGAHTGAFYVLTLVRTAEPCCPEQAVH